MVIYQFKIVIYPFKMVINPFKMVIIHLNWWFTHLKWWFSHLNWWFTHLKWVIYPFKMVIYPLKMVIYPFKMVIFHSSVSLPKGRYNISMLTMVYKPTLIMFHKTSKLGLLLAIDSPQFPWRHGLLAAFASPSPPCFRLRRHDNIWWLVTTIMINIDLDIWYVINIEYDMFMPNVYHLTIKIIIIWW